MKHIFDIDIFDSVKKKSSSPYPWEIQDHLNNTTAHSQDWGIFNIINSAGTGAVIAGGAALNWYQGRPVGLKDIDVWFEKESDLKKTSDHMSKHNFRKSYDTEHAETWTITDDQRDYRVQLIKKYHSNIQDILQTFDITVCQIATDGKSWTYTPEFARDLRARKLILTRIHSGSAKRLLKYWTYGFEPDTEQVESIINDPDIVWDYTTKTDEDYANAI